MPKSKTAKNANKPSQSTLEVAGRKKPVMQSDVPLYSLNEALRVSRAIGDHFAFSATRPLAVAQALNMAPTSSTFKMICGSSIAYGLTVGGYNAATIEPTSMARRILAPTDEGDDVVARRESLLKPRIIGSFLRKYDSNKLPREDIAKNVLVELGVPRDSTPRVLKLIVDSAKAVGFLREINSSEYVDLQGSEIFTSSTNSTDILSDAPATSESISETSATRTTPLNGGASLSGPAISAAPTLPSTDRTKENRHVFITHCKNKEVVPHLKALLEYGQFIPVISVDRESVSKPVPDKVLDDMRACGAAIIHVDAEQELISPEGDKVIVLNPNVLIEIGAAMALYGRRFILLVKDGVRLPTNLQGLYEVRYSGDRLDGDATLKLLKAFNDFKTYVAVSAGTN